eukprot:1153237-Pelagomonas_calceolata.AAC.3
MHRRLSFAAHDITGALQQAQAVDIYTSLVWAIGTFLLQLSCPCRQVQLCNPFLSYPTGSTLTKIRRKTAAIAAHLMMMRCHSTSTQSYNYACVTMCACVGGEGRGGVQSLLFSSSWRHHSTTTPKHRQQKCLSPPQ